MAQYRLLDDQLIDEIDNSEPEFQNDWLFLKETDEFPGFWQVEGVDDEFFYDFEDLLGAYQLISPARLDTFLEEVETRRYKIAFLQEPEHILKPFEALNADPPVTLNSALEKTRNGMLPWQIIGFNKLIKADLPAGLAIWDTGAGKTALEAAALKYWMSQGTELGVVVVKAHNKIDTQRKLLSLADLDSIVIDGDPAKRTRRYEEAEERLQKGPLVVVTNYESFRNDSGIMDYLVGDRRCGFCWDEMPTKLGNRDTQLYKAVKSCLYKAFPSKPRTAEARHLVLTATPIENDPEGLYNYLNLVRPRYFGTVTEFEAEHVTRRNPWSHRPDGWTGLDKIEARIEHMTHRVSKADPEVRAMFPAQMPPDPNMVIDWNPQHRRIYDSFTSACKDVLKEENSGINVLSMIQVLQMLCDAPSMVLHSANDRAAFLHALEMDPDIDPSGSAAALRLLDMVPLQSIDDSGHTKLQAWKDIITVKHPESKIVTHSTWASYIFPVWQAHLDEWGISYVTYSGTEKQKQDALDAFREDPSIRMFLSGDAGADSIDIPQADTGVSFNGAWKATTMLQRKGRINRVDSEFEVNYYYNLMMADSVEDRKKEIRDRKQGYHDAIFEGRALESALAARMSVSDLSYILVGALDEDV